jgi:hypothetical protein
MKKYGGMDVHIDVLLTSELDAGKWSASRRGSFTPRGIPPPFGTHWIGGCVCPRAGLNAVQERKNSCSCPQSKPGHPAGWPVALPTKLSRRTLLLISSIHISVTMQHKIVMVTLIFIHDIFRPYTAIIMCPRYAKLFTALPVSNLKLKLK